MNISFQSITIAPRNCPLGVAICLNNPRFLLFMKKITAYLLIGFAYLLYLVSAGTFIDYIYSLTIRDTVTAMENAFGTLVILIFMLVLAKFSINAGKNRLKSSPTTDRTDTNTETTESNSENT